MYRTTAALFAALAVALTTATAAEANTCAKAYTVRAAVVKKHGKRAPGRNICRWGVKLSNGKIVKATYGQKKRYLLALRRLNYGSSMLVAGRPYQPPAGTATLRAGGTLSAIAACESGGDPGAVDPSGTYRGKYQFTRSTWASVGGSGDPAAAPEAEQDQRAAALYAREGSSPWPVCGR